MVKINYFYSLKMKDYLMYQTRVFRQIRPAFPVNSIKCRCLLLHVRHSALPGEESKVLCLMCASILLFPFQCKFRADTIPAMLAKNLLELNDMSQLINAILQQEGPFNQQMVNLVQLIKNVVGVCV